MKKFKSLYYIDAFDSESKDIVFRSITDSKHYIGTCLKVDFNFDEFFDKTKLYDIVKYMNTYIFIENSMPKDCDYVKNEVLKQGEYDSSFNEAKKIIVFNKIKNTLQVVANELGYFNE